MNIASDGYIIIIIIIDAARLLMQPFACEELKRTFGDPGGSGWIRMESKKLSLHIRKVADLIKEDDYLVGKDHKEHIDAEFYVLLTSLSDSSSKHLTLTGSEGVTTGSKKRESIFHRHHR